VEYNHKELPKSVLFPLRDLGYIEIQKSTAGRGAKPYEIWRTDKFYQEISEPLLAAAAEQAKLVSRELFDQPLSAILSHLRSADRHVKGRALEILILYLARLIDLEFKGWRLRSADTGGAEVDAIVEGARLIFSRWQIQAKNTDIVRLDDVAKEVGRDKPRPDGRGETLECQGRASDEGQTTHRLFCRFIGRRGPFYGGRLLRG